MFHAAGIYLKTEVKRLPVIYVDVLIALNTVADFFLLRFTAALLKLRPGGARLAAGCALGGAGSLLILAEINAAFSVLICSALLCLMVLAVFGRMGVRAFLRTAAVFFAVNLLFGGFMLLIINVFAPDRAIYKNGAVYFDIDILTVVVLTVLCYAVLSAISFFAAKKAAAGTVYELRITVKEKTFRCRALYDTGNMLREVYGGGAVIVVSESLLSSVLPPGFADYTDPEAGETLPGFRLVPFSTVGRGGVLPAFRPGCVEVFAGGGWQSVKGAYIAVKKGKFAGGEFEAMLGSAVFDEIKCEVK